MLRGGSAAPALFSLEEPAPKDLYPGTFSRQAAAYKQRLDEVMARSESRCRAAVIDWVHPTRGKRILDLACGPGTLSYRLGRYVSPDGEVMEDLRFPHGYFDAAGAEGARPVQHPADD